MTIFFLVVGLEIRRELHDGALSDPRIATLRCIRHRRRHCPRGYLYRYQQRFGRRRGWACDGNGYRFAVACCRWWQRVPPALRMLLLTLAIIDDIAAILAIAFYYSNGIGARESSSLRVDCSRCWGCSAWGCEPHLRT